MLKTKTAKATVGGLDPVKEYVLQIHVIQGGQDTLIAKKKFISELHTYTDNELVMPPPPLCMHAVEWIYCPVSILCSLAPLCPGQLPLLPNLVPAL